MIWFNLVVVSKFINLLGYSESIDELIKVRRFFLVRMRKKNIFNKYWVKLYFFVLGWCFY